MTLISTTQELFDIVVRGIINFLFTGTRASTRAGVELVKVLLVDVVVFDDVALAILFVSWRSSEPIPLLHGRWSMELRSSSCSPTLGLLWVS